MLTEKEYAQMSARVYDASAKNELTDPVGWHGVVSSPQAFGLQYGVFTNESDPNQIVIAFTGTDPKSLGDLYTDVIGGAGLPVISQLFMAAAVYARERLAHQDAEISFTGHSLGGGLASVLAVWFNEPAVVFACAPFQLSVSGPMSPTLSLLAKAYLLGDLGYEAANLLKYSVFDFAERQENVENHYITGELMRVLPFSLLPTIEGTPKPIDIGQTPMLPGDRHNMDLHAAARLSESFRQALHDLPAAGAALFDSSLYSPEELTDDTRSALRQLVKRAADGALESFATDLGSLSGAGAVERLSDGLVAALLDRYVDALTGVVPTMISTVAGGVHLQTPPTEPEFDRGRERLQHEVAGLLDRMQRGVAMLTLRDITDWYVSNSDSTPLIATGTAANDVMIGGNAADQLDGGDGNDILIGGAGADDLDGGANDDYLSGGEGDDTLRSGSGRGTLDGGIGTDTYYVEDAPGNFVTIRDKDGLGSILVQGSTGQYALSAGLEAVSGTSGGWRNANGDRFAMSGRTLMVLLADGGILYLDNYQSTDLSPSLSTEAIGAVSSDEQVSEMEGESAWGCLGIDLPVGGPAIPPGVQPGAALYYADASGPHNGLVYGNSYEAYLESPALRQMALIGTENIDISAALPADGLISIGVYGGVGDSRIVGGAFNDYIYDDRYYDGSTWVNVLDVAGQDILIGAAGNDWLDASVGDDRLFGGDGNDMLFDSARATEAGTFDDVSWVRVPGNSSNDLMYGEAGDDVLTGAGGSAHMDGGVGADELYGGQDDDVLLGGEGDDVLAGDTRLDAAVGLNLLNVGLDPIWSFNGQWVEDVTNPGRDVLDGGDGNDVLLGGGLADVLGGGAGNDTLQGDTVFVPGGTRALFSNHGLTPVLLHGDDVLDGGAGNDTLYGGAGDDRLSGGDDADVIFGEDNPQRTGSEALLNPGADLIDGGAGDDQLFGNGGDDQLYGGDGDDYIYGGTGADYIEGGSGADYVLGDDVDGDAGADEIHGGGQDDQLFGLGGDDVLYGDDGNDQLIGGEGDDRLEGSSGDDLLWGEAGADTLRGGAGHDELSGGAGDDVLEAGMGEASLVGDALYGDDGDDCFVLSAGSGRVQITDTAGINRLVFGSGINAAAVSVAMSAGVVYIDYGATDYAYMDLATFSHLSRFEFDDGMALSSDQVRESFQPGALSDGRLPLLAGVGQADIALYRRGDDLLLSYTGEAADWVDTSTLAARDVPQSPALGHSSGSMNSAGFSEPPPNRNFSISSTRNLRAFGSIGVSRYSLSSMVWCRTQACQASAEMLS